MRQDHGVALPLKLLQVFGKINSSPARTAEVYTGTYHRLISRGSADLQTSVRQRVAHRIDWRFAIEPDGKGERTLVQQHRQSIHTAGAGLVGGAKERRAAWATDRIENHVMRPEQPRRNRRWIARIRSERCRINEKIDMRKLRTQCRFVPRHCFEARHGTKHPGPSKKRFQSLRERLRFFARTIDEDKAFTILERALPCNGMARPAARANYHHAQIANVD